MSYLNNSTSTASNGTANSIASNPASGSENRKPATAQQLVRENVQFLIEQLEAGKSETLTVFLDAMVHFPNYSLGDVLLIARQKPDARHVAGMWAWNQLGRRVKRGEKGIAILAPMIHNLIAPGNPTVSDCCSAGFLPLCRPASRIEPLIVLQTL